ncbi:MAG: hypothetical protein AB9856_19145 [Cellulosilyticaceae bacterium]
MEITTQQALQTLLDSGMKLSVDGGFGGLQVFSSIIIPIVAVCLGSSVSYVATYRIEKEKLKFQHNLDFAKYITKVQKELDELVIYSQLIIEQIQRETVLEEVEKIMEKLEVTYEKLKNYIEEISDFYEYAYSFMDRSGLIKAKITLAQSRLVRAHMDYNKNKEDIKNQQHMVEDILKLAKEAGELFEDLYRVIYKKQSKIMGYKVK